jgi:hypothetical protein
LARSIPIVAVAAVLAFGAPPALAAQRFAAPSPGGSGNCSSPANPCDIRTAITGAHASDEVIVAPGTYGPLTSTIAFPTFNLTVHGVAGQPRPRLLFNVGAGDGLFLAGSGDVARYLDVENSTGTPINADDGGTSIDQIFARTDATNTAACAVVGTITNSVCWGTATGDAGVDTAAGGGGTFTATVRNVTAWAPAAGSDGVLADSGSGSTVTVNATNVIAHAGADDFHASAASSSTATVNFDHSSFSTFGGNGPGTDNTNPGTGNQTTPPHLVNPGGGDFRELAGSPTVDAGIDSAANGPFDANGNARSLGARTDIGAYELPAAPAVAYLTPTPVTPNTEAVNGTVNPNGGVSTFFYEYGTTPALGGTTGAGFLGPATTPQGASMELGFLAPGTLYYYRLVASNDDGTTTGPLQTFTTAPPILSLLGRLGLIGAVSFKIDCVAGPCSGTAVLTVVERVHAGHVLSLARRRVRRRTVVVGRVGFVLGPGQTTRVVVGLNPTGRRLLKRFHRLPATLTITLSTPTGNVVVRHQRVTIKPRPRHRRHH